MERRKCKGDNQKGNRDRWLITYADLITLLLVFFIVMYSMSQVDAAKFEAMVTSLAEAMGAGGMIMESPGPAIVPGEPGAAELAEQRKLESIRQELEEFAREQGLATKIMVSSESRGIVLSFQEEVLFPSGSAQLTSGAQMLIKEVAPVLEKTDNQLRVEGHTDDLPIHTSQFPSNWELSSARATSVLQMLFHAGDFEPSHLSAAAYGEYRPRMPNDSPENRERNRRVDLVILRSEFKGAEPGASLDADLPSLPLEDVIAGE